jgi:hypothetical protein
MTDWWTGIPAAATTIECGGHTHTLRWYQGQLTAVDHDDPKAEATLAALANEKVPCLDQLRSWNQHRDDVRVLALASRGLTDRLDVAADRQPHPRAPIKQRDGAELLKLLALDGGIPDRLQAHAAGAWTRRLHTGHPTLDSALPQLRAALYGRLLAALRVWLDEPQLSITVTMVDASSDRTVERSADAVAIALPFAWLTEVWARGLATVFGRFCLGAHTDDGIHWTLDTVAPDLTTTAQLSITIR